MLLNIAMKNLLSFVQKTFARSKTSLCKSDNGERRKEQRLRCNENILTSRFRKSEFKAKGRQKNTAKINYSGGLL